MSKLCDTLMNASNKSVMRHHTCCPTWLAQAVSSCVMPAKLLLEAISAAGAEQSVTE